MGEFIRKQKIKLLLIPLIIAAIVLMVQYYSKIVLVFKDIESIKGIILGYGNYSFIIYIALQIVQIVIFFIPGDIMQISAGFIFGPIRGFLLSFLGICLGTSVVFFISRKLGKPFVNKIVSEKDTWIIHKLEKFKEHPMKDKKLKKIVFFTYLIPGIPKDILGYICGVSEIKYKDFIIYSSIARIPALFVSSFFGHKLSFDNWKLLAIIAIISGIIIVISIIVGKKIISSIDD
ncbi:TVP38/TMEM64 family protein [Clostridium intestinale]|uniref:TVP38/TMEM64 family membrane protein n=1 Tax=Clostridium intestinale TaxID=36845 RepID=A0A7D6ZWT0_9CLOT|nr:TVP38/TMEM64 family protein [Clostridium intestinale]QLY79354.1 TVP38/TMEM64 family protein [Clostridium intestinale]